MTKKEKINFSNKLVLDAGPLIDYLCDVGVAELVQNDIVDNNKVIQIIISPLTLTEIYYVLCRQRGAKFALESIQKIRNAVKIELEFNIRELAGNYKCERAFSLADCYVLATAKINSATAIFKREQELDDELSKAPLDVDILILD